MERKVLSLEYGILDKNMARHIVLNEQYRQFLHGERDDELVADVSLRASSRCHCEAYWMGFKDEGCNSKVEEFDQDKESKMCQSRQRVYNQDSLDRKGAEKN
jgi:hypothetical protein